MRRSQFQQRQPIQQVSQSQQPTTRSLNVEPQRFTFAKRETPNKSIVGNKQRSVTRSAPSQQVASVIEERPSVRTTSLQQSADDQSRFVAYTAQPQEVSDGNSFAPPAPPSQSPRAASKEFRRNLKSQKVARKAGSQGQMRLPVAPSLDQQQMEAISVLSNPADEGLAVDPVVDYDAGAESVIPESYEYSEINDTLPVETVGNRLRSPITSQEDDFLDEDEEPEVELPGLDDEDVLDDDFNLEDEENDIRNSPLRKSCEEFRLELLGKPITDIALDISPPANTDLLGGSVFRVWRDQYGNELAQGSIQDIRRGYLIIATSSGSHVRLPYARLSEADWLAVSDFWRLPIECSLGAGTYSPRAWVPQTVSWHASSLCHKPLYFENIQLERYGHSHGPFLQPVASGVHFFSRLFFLPYNTAINPPNECQYALGFYRPGNCAPWLRDPVPISLHGLARQTLFYSGVGYFAD